MTDGDIQFGDLEQATPESHRRPDRNRHYAVVRYGDTATAELPVYIDMDVAAELESHAQSDTSVELGGVLLGGQYTDDQGQPFVVITDSLRAKHYEATKGSFKFTHNTWTQITNERDEFPEDLQMVGWYHTHPGWGVFLSGMDTFICRNFFNKPLDVALVIDPCRGDRGFFEWTGRGGKQLHRTGGFYLVASRFRQQELEQYAARLEGKQVMATEPSGRPYPTPVIHLPEQRPGWLAVAVFGTLAMQVFLMLLIAWQLLLGSPAPQVDSASGADAVATVEKRLDELVAENRDVVARSEAQRELLDEIIGEVEIAPEGLVASLQDERDENRTLRTSLRANAAVFEQFEQTNERLASSLGRMEQDRDSLKERLGRTQDELAELKRSHQREIGQLKADLARLTDDSAPSDNEQQESKWWSTWWGIAILALAGIAVVAVVAIALFGRGLGRNDSPARPKEEAADED